MKLFEDEKLMIQIEDVYSFGIVSVGESKTVTIWVKNDASPRVTGYLRNLDFTVICLNPLNDTVISSENVEVLEAPKEMHPLAVEPLVLKWKPAVDLEQGLKAQLKITGQKIVG